MDSDAASSSVQQAYVVIVEHLLEGKVVTSATSVELTPALEIDQSMAGSPVRPDVVLLTYLPSELTEQNLEEVCQSIGPLLHFRLVCHPITGERSGYAFATFRDHGDATKACRELDGQIFFGKAIKVCPAREQRREIRQANLHIAGLSCDWTVMDLFSYFRYFGRVVTCKILRDVASGCGRAIGFVRYDNHSDAVHARSLLNNTVPAGETGKLIITFAHGNGPNRVKRMSHAPSSSGSGSSNQLPEAAVSSSLHPAAVPSSSNIPSGIFAPSLPTLSPPFGTFAPSSSGSGSSNQLPEAAVSSSLHPAAVPSSSNIPSGIFAPSLPTLSPPFGTFALFVGNLKNSHDENFLKLLFSAHGSVESVKIMKSGNANGGGYGFVNMWNGNQAFLAVAELNNFETAHGHHLSVSVKPTNERRTSS